MSFYPACGANWFQLLSRRSRAWSFSFNIVLKYRYALCRTRQKNAYVRYSCNRISNNWQLRWSTDDQFKHMVATMSVHGQGYNSFTLAWTPRYFPLILLAPSNLGHAYVPHYAQFEIAGWDRRCKIFACCWRNWNKAQKFFVHFGIFGKPKG